MESLLPLWPRGNLGLVGVDHLPVKLTSSRVNVNLVKFEPSLTLPGVTDNPEDENDWNGEPSVEELLSRGELRTLPWWGNGVEESGNQDEEAQSETDPRSSNTADSLEWNFIKSAPVVSPGGTESDVSKNDGSPSEEGSETREGKEPVEDDGSAGGLLDVCQSTANQEKSDGWKWATGLVNIGEDLWCVSFLGESGKSSGSSINARDTDGHDGNHDNSVDEVIETVESGIKGGDNERRGTVTVCASLLEETWVVGWNQKTDEGKTDNIEEGNTPENLLDCSWESLDWVLRLSSGKTNKFGSREGEGSSDEDGTETLETILECSRIVPSSCSPVLAVETSGWTTSTDEDDGGDHEDDNGDQLQA